MDKQERESWGVAVNMTGHPISLNPAIPYDPWDRQESEIAVAKQMYLAGTIDFERFESYLDQAFGSARG